MAAAPAVTYARNGDVSLAYQVLGGGSIDLIVVPGFASHLDLAWEPAGPGAFQRLLAEHTRLILYDRREQGLSDRTGRAPTLAEDVADLEAVLDAAGTDRAAILGLSQGGPTAIAFAAERPERAAALILYGTYARAAAGDGYPAGLPREALLAFAEAAAERWGGSEATGLFAPSRAGDPGFADWFARATRAALSPSGVREMLARRADLDVRSLLGAVRAPTLVVHRKGDLLNPVEHGRRLAAAIDGAEYVELGGGDHLWWLPGPEAIGLPVLDFVVRARGEVAGGEPSEP